jgi:stearoyl-CoA desaturase (Delta-9 desaturase)
MNILFTTDVIRKRVLRTGDGSHPYSKEAKKQDLEVDNNNEGENRDLNHFWGWDDEEMREEDKQVTILYRQYE